MNWSWSALKHSCTQLHSIALHYIKVKHLDCTQLHCIITSALHWARSHHSQCNPHTEEGDPAGHPHCTQCGSHTAQTAHTAHCCSAQYVGPTLSLHTLHTLLTHNMWVPHCPLHTAGHISLKFPFRLKLGVEWISLAQSFNICVSLIFANISPVSVEKKTSQYISFQMYSWKRWSFLQQNLKVSSDSSLNKKIRTGNKL